ncbi:hypothetical protein NEOLI_004517 [Neolecta irregularis DAH-3]|uniref:Uncharacterized protein n=1 Tax=Neolecta irregularis (strain DAH-3) TaxID=1198029 RepID=A0A1U7LQG4_NEOID|nr:hypothetical protein NEOLI_004517 [Neolecta irregularis DAH-3]|eukprot:OLL24761.1 hypothetical protein NEOLI_004517 [Neolecta irregularis DAH-3]
MFSATEMVEAASRNHILPHLIHLDIQPSTSRPIDNQSLDYLDRWATGLLNIISLAPNLKSMKILVEPISGVACSIESLDDIHLRNRAYAIVSNFYIALTKIDRRIAIELDDADLLWNRGKGVEKVLQEFVSCCADRIVGLDLCPYHDETQDWLDNCPNLKKLTIGPWFPAFGPHHPQLRLPQGLLEFTSHRGFSTPSRMLKKLYVSDYLSEDDWISVLALRGLVELTVVLVKTVTDAIVQPRIDPTTKVECINLKKVIIVSSDPERLPGPLGLLDILLASCPSILNLKVGILGTQDELGLLPVCCGSLQTLGISLRLGTIRWVHVEQYLLGLESLQALYICVGNEVVTLDMLKSWAKSKLLQLGLEYKIELHYNDQSLRERYHLKTMATLFEPACWPFIERCIKITEYGIQGFHSGMSNSLTVDLKLLRSLLNNASIGFKSRNTAIARCIQYFVRRRANS